MDRHLNWLKVLFATIYLEIIKDHQHRPTALLFTPQLPYSILNSR